MLLTERQKELVTGAFVLVLFGAGFGIGELTYRLLQLRNFGVVESVESSDRYYIDAQSGLRVPRPMSVHGKAHISAQGFRGDAIAEQKSADTLRLAYVGSSTTLDAYVDDVQTWPHIATRQIESHIHSCTVDSLNAGVPGYIARTSARHFTRFVERFAPDVVFFLPTDVGAALEELARSRGAASVNYYKERNWLSRHSLLWAKIEKNLTAVKLQRAAHSEIGKLNFDPDELKMLLRVGLDQFLKSARRGARLIVFINAAGRVRKDQAPELQVENAGSALLTMPYISIKGLLSAGVLHREVLQEYAVEKDIIVINIDDSIPADGMHYFDSSHYTAAGSRLMAEDLVQQLLGHPKFRAHLSRHHPECSMVSKSTTSARN